MQLNNKLVNEFQKLHLKRFGVVIGYNAAESQLKELSELVRLTADNGEVSKDA